MAANDGRTVPSPHYGAFVISLDFELHWGVRDWSAVDGSYGANLVGARTAVPEMLRLFREFDVAATWATVGFLFAESDAQLQRFQPVVVPDYQNRVLWPYAEPVGRSEADDPMHFAPSLIDLIKSTPRQEVGSHTYSHFYCLEPGQDRRAFEADLDSAVAIARTRDVNLRSLVFPRNQVNTSYAESVRRHDFVCFRGSQPSWLYRTQGFERFPPLYRIVRLLDSYVNISGHAVTPWERLMGSDGLCNIPASRFLRPYDPRMRAFDGLRVRRICKGIEHAARSRGVFHLWWHPHNFGVHLEENLSALRKILGQYRRMHEVHGMRSLSMAEVADVVAAEHTPDGSRPLRQGNDRKT